MAWWPSTFPDFTIKCEAPRHFVILNQNQEVVHHIYKGRAAAYGEFDVFTRKMDKVNQLLLGR